MKRILGLRTIKTALAVTITIIISNLLNLQYPYFAAMTALLAMNKSTNSSLKTLRNRTVGTLIGATIGIMLAQLSRGNPFLCGLGIIILISILNKLKLNDAIGIAGIVSIAIMLHTKDGIYFYAINRTIDTLIGGGVSLIINATIFPYYSSKMTSDKLDELWDFTHELISLIQSSTYNNIDIKRIDIKLSELDQHFESFKQEIHIKNKSVLANKCHKHLEMLKEIKFHLDAMNLASSDDDEVSKYHLNKALATYDYYLASL